MLTTENDPKKTPPGIIPSFVEGFNIIAGKVYIILFPVILDLLLWFGPLVRIKNLLLPALLRATEVSTAAYGDGVSEMIESSTQLWRAMLDEFNLLSLLRTYPVGIPSLMVSQISGNNPVGNPLVVELNSANIAFLWICFLMVLGLVLGSVYFGMIARSAFRQKIHVDANKIISQIGQSLLLTVFLLVLLVVIGIPVVCFISSIVLFLPSLGTLPFMIFGLLLVWVLLPLVFAPHGIFLNELRAVRAILQSVKLVRTLMAGTGFFFILVILVGYGLDALWLTPGTGSWMLLIGIFGHGFISSGLLAASFVFYRDGIKWLDESVRKQESKPQEVEI